MAVETRRGPRARGARLVGHTDLNGHGDLMQLGIKDHYLYAMHFATSGMTILDVSEPARPRVARQIDRPRGAHTRKVQIVGDLMMINYESHPGEPTPARAGVEILDISNPVEPRPVGFFDTGLDGPVLEQHGGGSHRAMGVHRLWWADGQTAYLTAQVAGWSHRMLIIVDTSDPTRPTELSRWWVPGTWTAGGEQPTWQPGERAPALHHGIEHDGLLYMGLWGTGFGILDVRDKSKPTLLGHVDWWPGGDHTHTVLPLPKHGAVVTTDEAIDHDKIADKCLRLFDVRDPRAPRLIGKLPTPEDADQYRGNWRYGPHNLHENRPDTYYSEDILFATFFAAGLRVCDVSNLQAPREIAYYVPEPLGNKPVVQSNDIIVDRRGLIYVGDRTGSGLHIIELT